MPNYIEALQTGGFLFILNKSCALIVSRNDKQAVHDFLLFAVKSGFRVIELIAKIADLLQ